VQRYVWASFGLLGLGLWAGCTQPVSQAFAPVPTPTPVKVDAPFVSEPHPLPSNWAVIPAIDEAIVPGEPGYFPYVQVHKVTVPDTVQANDIRDHRTILRGIGNPGTGFSETVPDTAVNTVVVGENAVLQGNESRKPVLAWFDGRRAYIHTFDSQPVRADGTVAMNPMIAPQPGLIGRPADYDRSQELPTIVPFFHQTATGHVVTDAILEVGPSPAPAAAQASPAPSVTTGTHSSLKSLSYFPAPAGYRFRSITTKDAVPNLANLPRARYWLNAPDPATLTGTP
jgi:hypothetical protein